MKLAVAALALLATLAVAPQAEADPADEARSVYRQFAAAQNMHDLEKVGSLLLDSPNFLWVSDGKSIWAVRYASDNDAPTLYHSREMEDVYKLYPNFKTRLGPSTRIVVSEPVGTIAEAWQLVPQNSSVRVQGKEITVQPFRPISPKV